MRYFIADTHFEHPAIIEMMARGVPGAVALFTCAEEHDTYLIDRINGTVGVDDELIVIGDFAFDNPGKYRARIKCKHVRLVLGNHDKKQKSLNVFGETPDIIRTKAYAKSGNDYVNLYCSHYPTIYWDGSHRGWGHLYGHCHGQREEYLDCLEPGRRGFDAGVDNIYRVWGDLRPISECEVYDYLAGKSGHDDIRFYIDYQVELHSKRREQNGYPGRFTRG